jgi:hypothetical protein
MLIGVLFWVSGTKTRRDVAGLIPANADPSGEADPAAPVG